MRKQMIQSVSDVIAKNLDTSLFLVDIGVWGFREILSRYPERAMNVGIFEDGITSLAAGMAMTGFTPFVYGISPFIIGRAYEQLKLDFCYQQIGGNFIGTGASYDFSTLGYSHYCLEDVELVRTLPGMEFIAPGTAHEFELLFNKTWNDGKPTYYRLSDYCNHTNVEVEFGKAAVIKRGKLATVVAISTTLDMVMAACENFDVTILYYTTLIPFDKKSLKINCASNNLLVCHPFFCGAFSVEILGKMENINFVEMGVPRTICRTYGTKLEKDFNFGFTTEHIKNMLCQLVERGKKNAN